jgi:D-xylose transport system substrate-binding protein
MRDGQLRVLKPAIDRGDIKIISQQFAKEWRADEALRITEDALTRTGKKIDAIVASNDGTAGGAISALEAAKLDGKVLVTGLDAQKDAMQRVIAGKQTMTIYTPIQPLAFSAVEAAIKLARKQPVDAPHKINNGKIDVPSILHGSIAVDKDNVDATVIKDGYHKREDIYGQ